MFQIILPTIFFLYIYIFLIAFREREGERDHRVEAAVESAGLDECDGVPVTFCFQAKRL